MMSMLDENVNALDDAKQLCLGRLSAVNPIRQKRAPTSIDSVSRQDTLYEQSKLISL